MNHVSLTPEQLIAISKEAETVIFYGGHTYMTTANDDVVCSPGYLIGSCGSVQHDTRFVWDCDMSLMPSAPRLTLVADNLYSWTPNMPGPHHQTYDEETQRFSTPSVISLGQYSRAVLATEADLPRVSIHFGYITVKAVKYDESLIALVNKVIDQYSHLEALNETKTA